MEKEGETETDTETETELKGSEQEEGSIMAIISKDITI